MVINLAGYVAKMLSAYILININMNVALIIIVILLILSTILELMLYKSKKETSK